MALGSSNFGSSANYAARRQEERVPSCLGFTSESHGTGGLYKGRSRALSIADCHGMLCTGAFDHDL